jgi:4-hydroxy-tetrahydrodipicolinate synthase
VKPYLRSAARQWVRANLRRYFVACYTPFCTDGEIDEPALRRNVHNTLAKPGVGGLSLHSIHQEFWTLTIAERKRITEAVLEEVAGKAPVVVGVSDLAARNVVDLARHAEAAGAAAVMIWPPFYGPRTPDGVRAFYEYVAEHIDIGFFAYSTTLAELGYWLDAAQLEQLLPIEHLCGVQVTALDPTHFDAMVRRAGNQICVTTSLEEMFLRARREFPEFAPAFTLGSSRPLFVQDAAHPYCGLFMDAALRGDFVEAEKYQRTIAGLAQRLQTRYFAQGFHHVSLFKRLAGLLGLETHGLRPPLSEPDPGEIQECVAVLKDAGLL